MSLWLTVKRREHPRGFLPELDKSPRPAPARKAPARRPRHAAKSARRTR